jgi:tellurite resistance protein TehA-like permease
MRNQHNPSKWQIIFASFFMTLLLSGISIKIYKFALLLSKQAINIEFLLVIILFFSVTGIILLQRFGIFIFSEKLFRRIHFGEWALSLLVILSSLVGFNGKLINIYNLILLDYITLAFNVLAIILLPICCNIIIDSVRHQKSEEKKTRTRSVKKDGIDRTAKTKFRTKTKMK